MIITMLLPWTWPLLFSAATAATGDARWHFPEAPQRAIVRVWLNAADAPVDGPLRVPLPHGGAVEPPASYRAWDLQANAEVAAQGADGELLLDAAGAFAPGKLRVFLVYRTAGAAPAPPAAHRVPPLSAPLPQAPLVARAADDGRVETAGYVAQIDRRHGGVIRSLQWKNGAERVETLGDGIRWWIGRKPQITPESYGLVPTETIAAGPVFTTLRVRYPRVLAAENAVIVDYRFFRDFLEVDFRYVVKTPVRMVWLKIPVSLRATGETPGLASNSRARDQAMITAGDKSRWILDESWHDVAYFGDHPFGLGVIAREALGGLYYMDSAKPREHEWIYAEPLGWRDPVLVDHDLAVQLAIVPHAPGRGSFCHTVAKLGGPVHIAVSKWQRQGDPPLDSDGDGVPDLVEIRRGTNPDAPDTDLDGIPDGVDPDPLRGVPPPAVLHLPHFTAQPTSRPQTMAEVRPVLGVPTLVIDGKPYGPMTYTRGAGSAPQSGEIADHRFPVHFEMVGSIGWPGQQERVFGGLDERVHRLLKAAPNVKVVLRLYVCNPPHFARDYPEEVLRFNDGSTQHFTRWYAMTDRPLAERGYPSFASEVWRRETARALYEYVSHVRQADYAPSVIGYFVCGGGTEEWYYWGDYDQRRYCVDFSPPMLRAFHDHLRRKYDGDVTKLRAAWGDPCADFATALPPGARTRRTLPGAFWPAGVRNYLRDYYEVHNKAMEEAVLIFAHAVKQACNRQQLVGMFHGYLQNHWLVEGGQATLDDVLNSPDIDFWSGPPQYDRRGPGQHGCNRFLTASLKRHGKLWICESDIRTTFSEPAPHNPALYGRPPDLDESLACLKREFAHQLCDGGNGWWFQMGAGWYHHLPILSLFEQMQTVGEAATGLDRTSDTDIAAVVDLESLFVTPSNPLSGSLLDAFKVQETCRIGAPVDHYELRDVLAPDAKHYKMYLMLNCFSLSDPQRRAVDERFRRAGAILVWMYAPGLFNPGRQPEESLDHTRELLGFPLRTEIGLPMGLGMRLTPAGASYFSGFDPARQFGSFERPRWEPDPQTGQIRQVLPGELRLSQRFYGDSPGAARAGEILARFSEGQQPSIVIRATDRATDLWIGSVMAPADLLRCVARRAGCHLYCDADEIIYANHSFLAIHTAGAGTRTFHLRRPGDVIEVFSGDVLARGATRFNDTIDAYRTRLYYLGPEAKWRAESRRADAFFRGFLEELKRLRAIPERSPAPAPRAE
jgi:hypothetical protein